MLLILVYICMGVVCIFIYVTDAKSPYSPGVVARPCVSGRPGAPHLPLQRVPIPPDVMKSILHCGLAAAAQPSLDLQLLRDCACLVTSYLFFNRSDTAFQLQRCGPDAMLNLRFTNYEPDLRIDEGRQQLNFVERNFKGKSKKCPYRLVGLPTRHLS